VLKVSLTDDLGLDKAASKERAAKSWDWRPDSDKSETNCAAAVRSVLEGGGMDTPMVVFSVLVPDDLFNWLEDEDAAKEVSKDVLDKPSGSRK
jgi:hypothetical protein